jgi:hypothetical protein
MSMLFTTFFTVLLFYMTRYHRVIVLLAFHSKNQCEFVTDDEVIPAEGDTRSFDRD